MGRSRIAWAFSVFAPWGMAVGMVVTATAKAGLEPAPGVARPPPPAKLDFLPTGSIPLPRLASLTLGNPSEETAPATEIEPQLTMKAHAALPKIDRTAKGDPFVLLRPGIDARRRLGAPTAEAARADPAPAIDASRDATPSPGAGVSNHRDVGEAGLQFDDGATPALPLAYALASSSPLAGDGLVRIIVARPNSAPQITVAAKADAPRASHYADLIDPKDAARQMRCLAEAIYFESRSEPETGQAAVAQVVLNRVRSGLYPSNVCGVVYQDRSHPFACQFSFACEGKSLRIEEPGPWAVATRVAKGVVEGDNYNPRVGQALNYHANYVRPYWAGTLRRVDVIGNHIFYKPYGVAAEGG